MHLWSNSRWDGEMELFKCKGEEKDNMERLGENTSARSKVCRNDGWIDLLGWVIQRFSSSLISRCHPPHLFLHPPISRKLIGDREQKDKNVSINLFERDESR